MIIVVGWEWIDPDLVFVNLSPYDVAPSVYPTYFMYKADSPNLWIYWEDPEGWLELELTWDHYLSLEKIGRLREERTQRKEEEVSKGRNRTCS